ncbi:hypothetical protein AB0C38_15960 [Amycolatopsis sp. NPDC048633]|uniref:hypothetical protein n=1 Tax=Amycolatopsis sp. NPDC048633 TaxID=3157095 RepID=UPI0033C6262C
MSSLRRVVGAAAIVAAAAILSACTGQQDSPSNGGATPAPTTTPAATTAAAAPVQATTSAQVAKPAPAKVNACASATKATLEAALKADEKASGALVIDGKGLQRIKCVAPWAFAHFSNDIDGGSVLFTQRNGTWVPVGGGTGELCEKVPAAIAQQICY